MKRSNEGVVKRFLNGLESGYSARLQIYKGPMEYDGQFVAAKGETFLVAHGWAVLARRSPKGNLFIFQGWSDYNKTTTHHLSLIKNEASRSPILKDKRPQMRDEP